MKQVIAKAVEIAVCGCVLGAGTPGRKCAFPQFHLLSVAPMNITQVIGELYRCHIDCGLESYCGYGFFAWVVDQHNRRIEKHFAADELDSIAEWLQAEVSRQRSSEERPQDSNTHHVLAELAGSERRGPKRVSHEERNERLTLTQARTADH
jgi:hypothetical protein